MTLVLTPSAQAAGEAFQEDRNGDERPHRSLPCRLPVDSHSQEQWAGLSSAECGEVVAPGIFHLYVGKEGLEMTRRLA